MAIKHKVIKPVRHAVASYADWTYEAGGTIVAGAPCVFSSGLVVEATDNDAGAAGPIVGFAQHAAVSGDQVLLAPPYPGRKFIGSLTDIAASVASDGGTKALAVSDISATPHELHKDDTTLKWVVGATGGASASVIILKLIDPVGATTDDDPTFGQEGETGPNSGEALVEFIIQVADTIFA